MSGSLRAALRLGAWVARGRPGRRQLSEVASSSAGGSGGADGGGGSGSREAVERLVREHPVVVFMKGSPAQPLCGFSNAVVQILRLHGVEDYRAHDVLQDPDLRQGQRAGVTSRRRLRAARRRHDGARCSVLGVVCFALACEWLVPRVWDCASQGRAHGTEPAGWDSVPRCLPWLIGTEVWSTSTTKKG
uniref:Glutaredoxin domain-containing protein n=1 Tax=Pavo cristatus TaxID=9049 RepID=A0A8C9EHR4_PAVCR